MGFFRKLFGKADLPAASDGCKLYAPLNGRAVPITDVPDPTFAVGLLGNGIYACFDAVTGRNVT